MTRRRRRKHEKRRRHRSQPAWGSHHSLITGAGVTAGAVLGLASPAMATDWVVNNTLGGGDNACVQPTDCTLRDAVYNANLNAGFDTIHFASGLSGTITLDGSEIAVNTGNLGIYGPGARVLTVSGANTSRIFNASGVDLAVSGLTLTGGSTGGYGGAINETGGSLTVVDSTISGNTAAVDGGALYAGSGTFGLLRSTVTGNTGGGVRTRYDTDAIRESTISVNPGKGFFPSHGMAHVYNSTIASNANEGIYAFHESGGVYLISDVLADAGVSNDINGSLTTFSAGFSLIETPGSTGFTTTNPNITGVDPSLGPLANNGGPTDTNRPSNTSVLLDKGSGTLSDQRGQPRPFDIASIPSAVGGNGADIGAVELQAADLAGPPPAGGSGPATGAPGKKKCKKKKHKSAAQIAKKCKKKK
jgi:hypothetical protein